MAFLKELRRRSKASFRTDNSTDTSSDGAVSHGTAPSSGSVTPPSLAQLSDPALNTQLKESTAQHQPGSSRPSLPSGSPGSRYSVSGMSGPGSPKLNGKPSIPLSPYAPRIHNVNENAWVYQKVLLLYGTIGEAAQHTIDGTVTVCRYDDAFPPTRWPVSDSHFKLLLYMQPGPNKIRLDFSSPKLANSFSTNPIHASYLTVHMMPPMSSPPLQLAILLAKDSPRTFDATPARVEREGNDLDVAVKKFRMAAYLWQAFTAEQMWRNKLGRRAFRFEEEWTTGTSNYRDRENGIMRSEAKIHIIQCDKTVEELRSLEKCQQYEGATDKDALYGIAAEAVKNHLAPLPGQTNYVSVLLLDAHWDTSSKIITGHAALGGGIGDLQMGIFGSHCLHSYPTSFEDVVPAFTDCTPTDTNFVANDCNDAGSSWEAANIGIGAHLHETGHLFGCPHQENGIMARDYVVLNRSFVSREAYSTRTKAKGGLALQGDECVWHRLDCLRFRAHPAFRLPCDPPMESDGGVQAFAVENGNIIAKAVTGISFVEIYGEGDDVCHTWMDLPRENGALHRQISLTDQDIRSRLPEETKKGTVRISIKSHGGQSLDIDDIKEFTSKQQAVKLKGGRFAFRSRKVGASGMEGTEPHELIFSSHSEPGRVMSRVIIYHGSAIDGLEFVYDDGSTQLFGRRGGKEGGDVFDLDVRRGEYLSGVTVRAGWYIDGLQLLTSLGRKSVIYGDAFGGSAHTLIPPKGFTFCGVAGTCGSWLDGFSILVKR